MTTIRTMLLGLATLALAACSSAGASAPRPTDSALLQASVAHLKATDKSLATATTTGAVTGRTVSTVDLQLLHRGPDAFWRDRRRCRWVARGARVQITACSTMAAGPLMGAEWLGTARDRWR